MRDPNRIDIILGQIGIVWKQYPDLRLGQLIEVMKAYTDNPLVDTFYIEDDELIQGLYKLIELADNNGRT